MGDQVRRGTARLRTRLLKGAGDRNPQIDIRGRPVGLAWRESSGQAAVRGNPTRRRLFAECHRRISAPIWRGSGVRVGSIRDSDFRAETRAKMRLYRMTSVELRCAAIWSRAGSVGRLAGKRFLGVCGVVARYPRCSVIDEKRRKSIKTTQPQRLSCQDAAPPSN